MLLSWDAIGCDIQKHCQSLLSFLGFLNKWGPGFHQSYYQVEFADEVEIHVPLSALQIHHSPHFSILGLIVEVNTLNLKGISAKLFISHFIFIYKKEEGFASQNEARVCVCVRARARVLGYFHCVWLFATLWPVAHWCWESNLPSPTQGKPWWGSGHTSLGQQEHHVGNMKTRQRK